MAEAGGAAAKRQGAGSQGLLFNLACALCVAAPLLVCRFGWRADAAAGVFLLALLLNAVPLAASLAKFDLPEGWSVGSGALAALATGAMAFVSVTPSRSRRHANGRRARRARPGGARHGKRRAAGVGPLARRAGAGAARGGSRAAPDARGLYRRRRRRRRHAGDPAGLPPPPARHPDGDGGRRPANVGAERRQPVFRAVWRRAALPVGQRRLPAAVQAHRRPGARPHADRPHVPPARPAAEGSRRHRQAAGPGRRGARRSCGKSFVSISPATGSWNSCFRRRPTAFRSRSRTSPGAAPRKSASSAWRTPTMSPAWPIAPPSAKSWRRPAPSRASIPSPSS